MKKEIITFKEPKSPISEIFRTLRTNIQFMNTKKGLKTILITSTSPEEGKSWVSANLAVTFAQAGKKVVLVDADMRKGRQFSIFGVQPTPGLSNFLSGVNANGEDSDQDILSYIKDTEVENLFLIPAGNVPPNPSELLVSEQMEETIKRLEDVYDLIIFDGTPCNLVTDAVIVSRYVDTTLIVTSYKQTKMDGLEKVKRDIENVGGKIAGVVINKVPSTQKEYYSTYYYGNTTSTKNKKSSKKKDLEFEIEKKRINNITKAKEVIKQNKKETEDAIKINENKNYTDESTNKYIQEQTTVPSEEINKPQYYKEEQRTSSLYNFDKDQGGVIKNAEEMMKKMNDYVRQEKEKLEKEQYL